MFDNENAAAGAGADDQGNAGDNTSADAGSDDTGNDNDKGAGNDGNNDASQDDASASAGDDKGQRADDKDAKSKKDAKANKTVPLSRFLKQHEELEKERIRNAELQRLIEAGGKKGKGDEDEALKPEDIQKLAKQQAKQIAAEEKFKEKTNEIYNAGVKEFNKSDFDGALDTIRTVDMIPADVIHTLSDLGDGHKVLKHLADDLELVEEIFAMSPTKRAIELTRLHGKLTAVKRKEVSKVTDPHTPLRQNTQKTAAVIDINDKSISAADRIAELRRQDRLARERKAKR